MNWSTVKAKLISSDRWIHPATFKLWPIKKLVALFCWSFAALFLSGCVPETQSKVVTTTGMIGDVVKNIGGDCLEIEVMMGPGIDPHLYKAS
ncbi:MAG: zinc ABC transporter substrate-binding protein, partial [Trueperaceae bacterium]|nr:zinc ABC transporter substrate-binding protein [Trueperaceae bacterium]